MSAAASILATLPADFAPSFGVVRSVAPGLIEASGPAGTLGALCRVGSANDEGVLAEIIAMDQRRILLAPLDPVRAIALGERVEALEGGASVAVGDGFGGRLVNALGAAIDGKGAIRSDGHLPLEGVVPAPLERTAPSTMMETGIRAIDAMLTLGRGQRVGIIAAGGVGKTSLVEQIAFQAEADHVVLCLVGERGREVESFWQKIDARADRARFTVVAATSDESAAHRARSPQVALALAEHWRAKGRHVLVVIDSVTRLAMALREIGLAAGAPPTVRAYTPNVFASLPRIVERCGGLRSGGAITAIMTVLSETDDADDPIVEVMKSLLDGHIILSRTLAEQGQFPAIDVNRSVSRGIDDRISGPHRAALREALAMLSSYEESRVLIETGAYRAGTNPILDRAIARRDALRSFLRQEQHERVEAGSAIGGLLAAAGGAR